MKKKDIIIIGSILAAAIGLYFILVSTMTAGARVKIMVDGEIYKETSLSKDQVIMVDNTYGVNVVSIESGEVRVTEADCRDHICVNHNAISKNNETIVCLPHKMVVEISGAEDNDVDAVVK